MSFVTSTGGSTNPPNITLAGLNITSGYFEDSDSGGGGVYNAGAMVTVSNCVIANCIVGLGGNGAGLQNFGTMTVINSTIANNYAVAYGAIDNEGTMKIVNSTISGNTAYSVAAIGNDGVLTLLNSTVTGGSASLNGAIDGGTLLIGSTILGPVGGTSTLGVGDVIHGPPTVISLGYNLCSDNGNGYLTNATDQINTDPMLGPLQDNGGPTPTQAPLCGSPAIDKGTNLTGFAADQRGAPRISDDPNVANANGGDGTDIGAVESPTRLFTVLNTNDSGPGSLRQAILDANTNAGMDVIEFAPSAYGTITATSGELLITDCLFINGPGATNVAVNGNAASRVFNIGSGITVTIAGLTITNGAANAGAPPGDRGGGIFNDHSTLTVSNSALSGNSATFAAGGIYNDHGTLTVSASTLSGNSAFHGAGIYDNGASSGGATLTVVNSTLSGNSAGSNGGGIVNDGGGGGSATLTVLNSTFSGNSDSGVAGGIDNLGFSGHGTLEIGSTILNAGARGGNLRNLAGTITSDGYNLSSDSGSGFLNQPTDQTNTPPLLGPLQLNGGQTPTHALVCGSPAIDKGTNFLGLATDQRGEGFPRTFGAATDIGAFELEQVCNNPPVALCTNVTISANSNCVAYASIDHGSYDPDVGDTITNRVQVPPGPYGLGTNLVTLTVTDSHGALDSCTATVIVVDTTPPTINCPANIVATNDPGQCSAVVSYSVTASDACSSVSLSEDFPSGSTFPHGTNTVTVTGVDHSGNTNTCTFTITVLDREAPLVSCRPAPNPSGKIPPPGKGGGTGQNPGGYYELLAKDNCDPNPAIYIKDTASSFVAGPFHDGDIVRVKHTGGTPSSVPGTAPVVAIISLNGNGLTIAQDADGNVTPDAAGCALVPTLLP